ncbi:MAG: excisionase family DNA-binding protein [Paracoccus sp. (in: a-proteobacteria)]|nr:excisionase family DNA-binding protein [Paracoccus sp. (in: a-proteobacteria)]
MTSSDEHQFLTPEAAAKRAGVSRPTINRALKTRELQAHRDNRNRWQIGATDLDAWAEARRSGQPDQTVTSGHDQFVTTPEQLEKARLDLATAREELAAAHAANSQLESRIATAEADRDRWQKMAEKLADRPPPAPPRRRWWPW